MITRNLIRMAIILILIAGFPNPIRADIVTLKNGSALEGTISARGRDTIVLVVPGRGPLKIDRSTIESIVKQDLKVSPKGHGNVEEVTFLSRADYLPEVRKEIQTAKESIHVAMYLVALRESHSASVEQILEDVAQARKRGVEVKIVLESPASEGMKDMNNRAAEYLTSNGVEVRMFPVFPIMHAKLVIIDGDISILGSHNWSFSAFKRNNESSVIIKSPVVARKYEDFFKSLFRRAKPYS